MGTPTQNSPAMRVGLAGSFAGSCYGRFVENHRTCQHYPSKSAPGGSRLWQVIFDLMVVTFVVAYGRFGSGRASTKGYAGTTIN